MASSIREGFGLNIIEGQYCGLPIVATRNRGHASIISDQNNGFLVNIGDSTGMARRVVQLLEDPQLRVRFAQCDVSRYGAEAVAARIYAILKRV